MKQPTYSLDDIAFILDLPWVDRDALDTVTVLKDGTIINRFESGPPAKRVATADYIERHRDALKAEAAQINELDRRHGWGGAA